MTAAAAEAVCPFCIVKLPADQLNSHLFQYHSDFLHPDTVDKISSSPVNDDAKPAQPPCGNRKDSRRESPRNIKSCRFVLPRADDRKQPAFSTNHQTQSNSNFLSNGSCLPADDAPKLPIGEVGLPFDNRMLKSPCFTCSKLSMADKPDLQQHDDPISDLKPFDLIWSTSKQASPNLPKEEECKSNDVSTDSKTETETKTKYIPPHLRHKSAPSQSPDDGLSNLITKMSIGSTAATQFKQKLIKSRNLPSHQSSQTQSRSQIIKWYDDESEFEFALGTTLKSLRLDDPSYIDTKRLHQMTNFNANVRLVDLSANPLASPMILYVVGPPAVGKSSQFTHSLFKMKLRSSVICDGDMVRKCHFGIEQYLKLTKSLQIGYTQYFRKFTQKWSGRWKQQFQEQAMKQKKDIITFSTCYRSNECIQEMNTFWNNGYCIKILMVCAEFEECRQMGFLREGLNGRKYRDGTYSVSMQGCMDVIDYLIRRRMLRPKKDLVVIQNGFTPQCGFKRPQKINKEWGNMKNQILIPMRMRAIDHTKKRYLGRPTQKQGK